MYLVGSHHPHKIDAQRHLERFIAAEEALVTDTEVLQEILHRYSAIHRLEAVQPAFDAILGVVDQVFDIRRTDAERAKSLLLGDPKLGARDALHAAVMHERGVRRILSFDRDFDRVPGLERIS